MAVISSSQLPELFLRVVKGGTSMRIQSLQALNTAIQNQADALKFEESRMISLYGANSHQAILVKERLLEQATLSQAVSGQLQKSQVPVPQPSPNHFVVYGRVLDSAGRALKDMEVSATDAQGAVIVGAVSDANGRYVLPVAAAAPADGTTFQLVVSDKNRATLLQHPETLKPAAGMLAYRDITIPAAAK
jgi:hypothetical protein